MKPGPAQFIQKLLELWRLDEDAGVRLLGAENSHMGDRIRHLFAIRATLDQLLRNVETERAWLNEPRPELDRKSPMQLLLEGSMENLILVKHFVERLAGR